MYYSDMQKDAKLYVLLEEKLKRFIGHDKLLEIAYDMDTNTNESFNNTVDWFAPKNKVYCGSRSLSNRVGMAIGITSIGFMAYFENTIVCPWLLMLRACGWL